MTTEQLLENLKVPEAPIDIVLDTDAYNEIDDQFAIAYLLRSKDKLNTKAIYAAPFTNPRSKDALDGMEKSYDEILKLLSLMDEKVDVFKGSGAYLTDESTFVDSPAARDLAKRAEDYSPKSPLYVVAIGAITNVASAILMNPKIAKNIVVVWLGGHAHHIDKGCKEFNMEQDIAATRVVMQSDAAFVQLPCAGVVSEFRISKPELEYWLCEKTPISDYLANNTILEAESYAKGTPWSRTIWDVTAVAWLLNDNGRFMRSRIIKTRLPQYNNEYSDTAIDKDMRYVYKINRDTLMWDLIKKLIEK